MKITNNVKALFCTFLLCFTIVVCSEEGSYNYQEVEISKLVL